MVKYKKIEQTQRDREKINHSEWHIKRVMSGRAS